jgi:hypothetical protein
MTSFTITVHETREQRTFTNCLEAVRFASGRYATIQRMDKVGNDWRKNGRPVPIGHPQRVEAPQRQPSLDLLREHVAVFCI